MCPFGDTRYKYGKGSVVLNATNNLYSGAIIGKSYLGGIVGKKIMGVLSNNLAIGSIKGDCVIGGILGAGFQTSKGGVSIKANVGMLVNQSKTT